MTIETKPTAPQDASASLPVGPVFDVDPLTGFMASKPPIPRLPEMWEDWERLLDSAITGKLQCGDRVGLTEQQAAASDAWRGQVRTIPVLQITPALSSSPVLLRRAHVVLTFLLHFYVQTLPPNDAVIIPRSLSLPLLHVSTLLDVPPLLTFSDTVLYNWDYKLKPMKESPESEEEAPQLDNLRSQTTFSGLVDEEEFYLCSARIELRGVEALELMRQTMDEMFVGDGIAIRRISGYLRTMVGVINELKTLLLDVRKHCDPERYYNEVRPWFRGEDSDVKKRKWVYEGVEDNKEGLIAPVELSGPSAGQSSLVHVLDIFLGVDHQSTTPDKPSFMARMLTYMPRNHRLFLKHLSSNPRPLRAFVVSAEDAELQETYNQVVSALKEFRDAHMIIATLYIIGPARRAARAAMEAQRGPQCESEKAALKEPLKGTGGTDLVKFLKDTRNRTGATMISVAS